MVWPFNNKYHLHNIAKILTMIQTIILTKITSSFSNAKGWTSFAPYNNLVVVYSTAVCSTFTHACESWDFAEGVRKTVNRLNSRCLNVIKKEGYRVTTTRPKFNLELASVVCFKFPTSGKI